MPWSGPRGPLALALGVERVRDGERVRVELDHRAQRRTAAIDVLDPPQVQLGDLPRRVAAGRHPVLQLRGGDFFERKRGLGGRGTLNESRENQGDDSALHAAAT